MCTLLIIVLAAVTDVCSAWFTVPHALVLLLSVVFFLVSVELNSPMILFVVPMVLCGTVRVLALGRRLAVQSVRVRLAIVLCLFVQTCAHVVATNLWVSRWLWARHNP